MLAEVDRQLKSKRANSCLSQAMIRERELLEAIAMLVLELGRLLMEAGSSARHVDEITTQVAIGWELNAWACE